MSQSQIIRIPTGIINNVKDAAIGQASAPLNGLGSVFDGQLGKEFWLADDEVRYDSSIGTVYGGWFMYVKLGAGTPVIGQAVFWLDGADPSTVTTAENTLTYTSTDFAGVIISTGVTTTLPYTVIKRSGRTYVHYRAAIGGTKATGRPVSLANQGAGADLGFFDIVDVDLPQYKVGYAISLPADGALGLINMDRINPRN